MAVGLCDMAAAVSQRGNQLGTDYGVHAGYTYWYCLQVVQLLRETHADKITPEAQLTLVKCLLNNQPQYPPGRSYCRCRHGFCSFKESASGHICATYVDAAVCSGR